MHFFNSTFYNSDQLNIIKVLWGKERPHSLEVLGVWDSDPLSRSFCSHSNSWRPRPAPGGRVSVRTLLGLFGGAISAPHFRRNGARCSSASREDSEKRPQNEGRDGGQRPPSSAARPASPRLLPRACKVHFRARLGTATLPAPLRRLQLFLPKPQGAGRGRDRRCTEQRGASAERRARRLRGPHPARSPAPWPCRCFLHQREREALGGARRRSPSRGQQVAGPGRTPQVGTLVAVPDVCLGVKKGRAPLRTPPEGASVRRLLTGGRGRGRDASQGLGTGPHSLQRRKPRASCHRAVLGTRQLLALCEVSAASASAPRARPAVAPEAEVAEMRPRLAWRSGLSSDA